MGKRLACVLMLLATTVLAQQPEPSASSGLPDNFRDLPLAALGKLTLDCLGTVNPTLYSAARGRLARTFDACTQDSAALAQIDEILGAQDSIEGIIDGLGPHYARRWSTFVSGFPARVVRECPTWTLQNVIDAPTDESIARMKKLGRPGKESYRYTVSSRQCRGNAQCSVVAATACAGGFGPEFIVESDVLRGRIEVDPVWWLTRGARRWENDDNLLFGFCDNITINPTLTFKLFGTLDVAGQQCCFTEFGKTWFDGVFQPIDCGGGWFCMTYCFRPPG